MGQTEAAAQEPLGTDGRLHRQHREPVLEERDLFIDNLLVRIHLIIERILVDRPCAMGVSIPFSRQSNIYLPSVSKTRPRQHRKPVLEERDFFIDNLLVRIH